jgi:hydrogenase maturation factor
VTITLSDQTQIRRQVNATPADMKPGDRVVVTGPRGADGTVLAAMVQIQAQGQ